MLSDDNDELPQSLKTIDKILTAIEIVAMITLIFFLIGKMTN